MYCESRRIIPELGHGGGKLQVRRCVRERTSVLDKGVTWLFFEKLFIDKSCTLLTANVEGAIATDREEPFRRRLILLPVSLSLEFDERLLHHVAGSIAIYQDSRGVLEQRQLKAAQEGRQTVIGWDWFGHAHKLFRSNPPAAELLRELSWRRDHPPNERRGRTKVCRARGDWSAPGS